MATKRRKAREWEGMFAVIAPWGVRQVEHSRVKAAEMRYNNDDRVVRVKIVEVLRPPKARRTKP